MLIEPIDTLLAREGFLRLGVNAVAREAKVDKILNYWYFGDMSELIAAFGREANFWPSIKGLAGGDIEVFGRQPVTTRMVVGMGTLLAMLTKCLNRLRHRLWKLTYSDSNQE